MAVSTSWKTRARWSCSIHPVTVKPDFLGEPGVGPGCEEGARGTVCRCRGVWLGEAGGSGLNAGGAGGTPMYLPHPSRGPGANDVGSLEGGVKDRHLGYFWLNAGVPQPPALRGPVFFHFHFQGERHFSPKMGTLAPPRTSACSQDGMFSSLLPCLLRLSPLFPPQSHPLRLPVSLCTCHPH